MSRRPARNPAVEPPSPDVRAWLDAHVNLETGVGVPREPRALLAVDRIRPIVDLLGSPQLDYPSIHVTGTNGKTSVVRLTAALLGATGLAIGSYTSPHLERVNERMAYDGEPIDDLTLTAELERVAAVEEFLPEIPSYFEILTAAALHWFGDLAVDAAVVEVGLGGAGDATNVVEGHVAVVTNVSLDHVEYIGPTIDDIALEKSGIVKPGSVLVLGEVDPVIQRPFLAREAASVLVRDRDFGLNANTPVPGGRRIDIFTPYGVHRDVFLSLRGSHQADNAALALVAAESLLGTALAPELVAEVLAGVSSPGRLEVVGSDPLVVLDGAHNVAGAHALRDALAEEFPRVPITFVVGLLREKDPLEMLAALGLPGVSGVVACRAPSPRGRPPEDVATAARALGLDQDRIAVVDDVGHALAQARARTPVTEQVVVTGSLYVVGAARASLHAGAASLHAGAGGGLHSGSRIVCSR